MWLAAWRVLIWAGIALGLYFVVMTLVTLRDPIGSTGLYVRYVGGPISTYRIERVDAGSPGARAGLRVGDTLRLGRDDPEHRLLTGQVRPGDVRVWIVDRTGRHVTLVAEPQVSEEAVALALTYALVQLVMLLGAAVIAMRATGDRAARLLAGFFVAFAIGAGGPSPQGTPRWLYDAWFLLDPAVIYLGAAQGLIFASVFPHPSESGFRRLLERLATPLTGVLIVAAFAYELAVIIGPPPDPRILVAIQLSWIVYVLAIAAAFSIADREASGTDRRRVRWVASSLIIGFSGPAFWVLLGLQGVVDPRLDAIQLTVVAIPLGTGYAILRHRVIDLGFVINRALVFTIVSAVIVTSMGILEWVLEKTLVEQNHVTSVSLEVALALVLGYFLRRIHNRIDRFVDYVFFRDRHRAESALRNFAHDVHFITDLTVLLERTARMLVVTGEASYASIWLTDESGGYVLVSGSPGTLERIDENDPVVVRMKAVREPVDISELESALVERLTLPMFVRGTLTGFVQCGPKKDDEEYDPDEIETLAHVAHEVALAIEALRVEMLEREVERVLAEGGSLEALRSVARFALQVPRRGLETGQASSAS